MKDREGAKVNIRVISEIGEIIIDGMMIVIGIVFFYLAYRN